MPLYLQCLNEPPAATIAWFCFSFEPMDGWRITLPTPDVSRMGSSMGMTDVGGSLGWKVRTYALPPLALPSLGAIGSPTVQSSGPNGSPSGRSCLLPLGLPSLGSILPFFHRDCGSFSTSPGRWSTEHQLLFLNFQPHFYFFKHDVEIIFKSMPDISSIWIVCCFCWYALLRISFFLCFVHFDCEFPSELLLGILWVLGWRCLSSEKFCIYFCEVPQTLPVQNFAFYIHGLRFFAIEWCEFGA